MIARAERLHREFFRPSESAARQPAWEPPIDLLETEQEILVLVALPGVSEENVEIVTNAGELIFTGVRAFPAELQTATIHRLELPQGRFERRLRLPPGRYGVVRRSIVNGCLLITIPKEEAFRG